MVTFDDLLTVWEYRFCDPAMKLWTEHWGAREQIWTCMIKLEAPSEVVPLMIFGPFLGTLAQQEFTRLFRDVNCQAYSEANSVWLVTIE